MRKPRRESDRGARDEPVLRELRDVFSHLPPEDAGDLCDLLIDSPEAERKPRWRNMADGAGSLLGVFSGRRGRPLSGRMRRLLSADRRKLYRDWLLVGAHLVEAGRALTEGETAAHEPKQSEAISGSPSGK